MKLLAARVAVGFFLFLVIAAGGCGNGMQSSVTGVVTLDGKPVTHGTVSFTPVKDGPSPYGTIASDGSYSLNTGSNSGVNPGEYIAVVVIQGPAPPMVPGKAPEAPKPISPAKYGTKETSDLKVTVNAGGNVIPLNMVTPK